MDVQALCKRLTGRFIVFDGPDGGGKSTQRARLERLLRESGVNVVSCRDPGGTEIGDRIRSVLLDHDLSTMDVHCETLLFMASRAQLVGEIIRPALQAGRTVLCDRYVSSTCAYQGAAGFDPARVVELARFAIEDCWPHVTVVLDLPVDLGLGRVGRKPGDGGRKHRKAAAQGTSLFVDAVPDAMESRPVEFHRRVRDNFVRLGQWYPAPVVVVDAAADEEAVFQRVLERLDQVRFA